LFSITILVLTESHPLNTIKFELYVFHPEVLVK